MSFEKAARNRPEKDLPRAYAVERRARLGETGTILITGANGFVGRALVERLREDHDLVLIDRGFDDRDAGPRITRLAGDFGDPAVLKAAFGGPISVVVALASVPGGAAEASPRLSRRVNLEAMLDLLEFAVQAGSQPRFLFASSIAVFGDGMPPLVEDSTPPAPTTTYGLHKAMIEAAVAHAVKRGGIQGCSLRLPGIVARPRGHSGMKTAFLSEVVHAVVHGEPYRVPVSPHATTSLMSLPRLIDNLVHAIGIQTQNTPTAITLPTLSVRIDAFVAALGRAVGDMPVIRYDVDESIQRSFGRQSPFLTLAAEHLGYAHDGDIDQLAARAVAVVRGDLVSKMRQPETLS